ncbi:hypothetical protein F383_37260 [Gossypium arboreum]|uniref:Uncharacterized protein n=1 Tax=Gossypium arboreum TaxID=29729 RepID=A0A0B0M7J2_GOSAR|nr:hypothetical protein F383_37260 [Gossypium arboreum]
MPLSQTGSYTEPKVDANVPGMVLHDNTYRILFHDICILTIPRVCTGLFGRRNFVDTFSDIS